jgi:hypothetical protein
MKFSFPGLGLLMRPRTEEPHFGQNFGFLNQNLISFVVGLIWLERSHIVF